MSIDAWLEWMPVFSEQLTVSRLQLLIWQPYRITASNEIGPSNYDDFALHQHYPFHWLKAMIQSNSEMMSLFHSLTFSLLSFD